MKDLLVVIPFSIIPVGSSSLVTRESALPLIHHIPRLLGCRSVIFFLSLRSEESAELVTVGT